MRRTIEIGIRAAATLLLLAAVTACSTPADGGDGDGDASPSVSITAPTDGATFASGASISFTGSADDAEDGDLSASLSWSSNLDDAIGAGGNVSATLSDGTHVVTASVTDSAGQTTSTSVTVTVGDGGGGGTPGTRDVGYIVVDELDDGSLAPATVNGNGGFARFDADVPAAFFSAPWEQLVGTCDVTTLDFDDPFEGLPFPGDLGMTFLEAGDPLDVTADGDLYLELDRMETTFDGDTIVAYGTTDDVAGPLAENLALDVPGDEFPAVANAAFPDAAPFELTAPANPGAAGSVDVDTAFEWSGASEDANTIVRIDLVASDRTTFVTCYAADTGSFALPDATKTELGGAFSGFVEGAGRESVRVETIGDARLLLVVSRAQTFSTPIILPPFPTQR